MVKMVAKGTLQLRQEVAPPDSRIAGDRGRHKTVTLAPGTAFDSSEYGLSEDDVKGLESQARDGQGGAELADKPAAEASAAPAGAGPGEPVSGAPEKKRR